MARQRSRLRLDLGPRGPIAPGFLLAAWVKHLVNDWLVTPFGQWQPGVASCRPQDGKRIPDVLRWRLPVTGNSPRFCEQGWIGVRGEALTGLADQASARAGSGHARERGMGTGLRQPTPASPIVSTGCLLATSNRLTQRHNKEGEIHAE